MNWREVVFWAGLPIRLVMMAMIHVLFLVTTGKSIIDWKAGITKGIDAAVKEDKP